MWVYLPVDGLIGEKKSGVSISEYSDDLWDEGINIHGLGEYGCWEADTKSPMYPYRKVKCLIQNIKIRCQLHNISDGI